MAPVSPADHDVVERQLKDLIQDLYQLMVQVETYDTAGRASREVLAETATHISTTLQTISRLTSSSSASNSNNITLPSIPPELIQYVDNGRNPDIYTREFVELARKGNQLMKGKLRAFESFRDVLAGEMARVLPELEGDVRSVVDGAGNGSRDVKGVMVKVEEGGGS